MMPGANADAGKGPKGGASQLVAFVAVGGFAAAVNWGSRFAFSNGGMPLAGAIVCAYVMGMATAYVLSRRFVFDPSGNTVSNEVARFTLVNMVALAQVWGVTMLLTTWIFPAIRFDWRPEAVAHGIGVASPILTSYFGHRHFTFRKAVDGRIGKVPDAAET
jgi:putative flippase GtrA